MMRVALSVSASRSGSCIGSRHAGKASRLADLLRDAVGSCDGADTITRAPRRAPEMQPDIAVVKLRDDYYESSHPASADVLLLVEVSVATLRYDLDIKVPLYAASSRAKAGFTVIASRGGDSLRWSHASAEVFSE